MVSGRRGLASQVPVVLVVSVGLLLVVQVEVGVDGPVRGRELGLVDPLGSRLVVDGEPLLGLAGQRPQVDHRVRAPTLETKSTRHLFQSSRSPQLLPLFQKSRHA